MKAFLDRLLGLVTGRYKVLAILVVALVLVLFGRDIVESIRLRGQIRELERRKAYYQNRIEEDSTLLENLRDRDFLERYAREKYLMRVEGEEIYIIRE